MGLKSDIMKAKKRTMLAQGIDVLDEDFSEGSPNEIEAKFMTEAIVNFLTHDDLHFTISKLKASVELEEFNLSEDLDADVKMKKVIGDKLGNLWYIKMMADLFVALLEAIAELEIPVVKAKPFLPIFSPFLVIYKKLWKTTEKKITEQTPQTEGKEDINIPKAAYRKDGGKQGGEMDARGHAHIGIDDPVKNSDTMDPESDDNLVDLYRDKIPDELLD